MSIGADLIRGHTDAIILAQLLKKDSYGYEINKTISRSSEGEYELKEATLYTAFKRLEDSGQITSYWGSEPVDPGSERSAFQKTLSACLIMPPACVCLYYSMLVFCLPVGFTTESCRNPRNFSLFALESC